VGKRYDKTNEQIDTLLLECTKKDGMMHTSYGQCYVMNSLLTSVAGSLALICDYLEDITKKEDKRG
jgi:hypothetical protein